MLPLPLHDCGSLTRASLLCFLLAVHCVQTRVTSRRQQKNSSNLWLWLDWSFWWADWERHFFQRSLGMDITLPPSVCKPPCWWKMLQDAQGLTEVNPSVEAGFQAHPASAEGWARARQALSVLSAAGKPFERASLSSRHTSSISAALLLSNMVQTKETQDTGAQGHPQLGFGDQRLCNRSEVKCQEISTKDSRSKPKA